MVMVVRGRRKRSDGIDGLICCFVLELCLLVVFDTRGRIWLLLLGLLFGLLTRFGYLLIEMNGSSTTRLPTTSKSHCKLGIKRVNVLDSYTQKDSNVLCRSGYPQPLH